MDSNTIVFNGSQGQGFINLPNCMLTVSYKSKNELEDDKRISGQRKTIEESRVNNKKLNELFQVLEPIKDLFQRQTRGELGDDKEFASKLKEELEKLEGKSEISYIKKSSVEDSSIALSMHLRSLKEAELKAQLYGLKQYEQDVKEKERDLQRCLKAIRNLINEIENEMMRLLGETDAIRNA